MNVVVVLLMLAITADGVREGEVCTKDGEEGVCTNIRTCAAAQRDIENRKKPQVCEFVALNPVVCCVSPPATSLPVPALTTTKRVLQLNVINSDNIGIDETRVLQENVINPDDIAIDETSPPTSTTESVPHEYDYFELSTKDEVCEPIPPSLTAKKTGQKAFDKCIEYQDSAVYPCEISSALAGGWSRSNRCHHDPERLMGGGAAALNEFPHMVLLGYGSNQTSLWWLCSGALVSPNFVLTSGHCTSHRDIGAVTFVQFGPLRLSSVPARSRRSRIQVKRIVKHPDYSPPTRYNDIALLELSRRVPLDEFTVPACLPAGAPPDARAVVTGWGLAAFSRNTSDEMQQTTVNKFESQDCARTYKPTRLMKNGFNETTQTCYGDKDPAPNSCHYDGGSPLQIKNNQISCMYTIVGVTSIVACEPGVPSVYSRVAHYVPWIEDTVWPS